MQSEQMEPSGIEPESCNRPFVGFGAVERQSRPQKWLVMKLLPNSRVYTALKVPTGLTFTF
ncbi:MAG: hypothetical protein SAL70_30230 [Scytonema sp. PMC 1070.18]|nr:hypothetical protein [Scytonema sp. PMC 1070.18]